MQEGATSWIGYPNLWVSERPFVLQMAVSYWGWLFKGVVYRVLWEEPVCIVMHLVRNFFVFSKCNPSYLCIWAWWSLARGEALSACLVKAFCKQVSWSAREAVEAVWFEKPRGNLQTHASPWSLTFSKFISHCKILLFTEANQDNLKLGQFGAFSLTKGNLTPPHGSAGGKCTCNMQIQENTS